MGTRNIPTDAPFGFDPECGYYAYLDDPEATEYCDHCGEVLPCECEPTASKGIDFAMEQSEDIAF